MSKGDIEFSFTVNTCLEPDEIERLLAAENDDDQFQVLNEIFGEDPNIWDRYYEAALEAFRKRNLGG